MQPSGDIRLVYDGDCEFCRYCVDYARARTGERVAYVPFQSLPPGHGALEPEDYLAAVQLFVDTEHRARGAEASFMTLAYGRSGVLLSLYRRLPLFARLAEAAYRWVAGHRPLCLAVSRLLFGPRLLPLEYTGTIRLFNRLLALLFLVAFVSFGIQARGLVGSQGILPVAEHLAAVREQLGPEAYRLIPTLLWLDASDTAILALCVAGVLASLLLFSGALPRLAALLATGLYLSLVQAGQVFTLFQWDMLLLECGFLAAVTAQWPRLGVWLYRWLLFRFMFLSGAVKLLSDDPNWRALTALRYHFETQPLPSVVAWYAHQLGDGLLRAMTGAMFAIELLLPFFMLGPRRLRVVAALGTLALQLAIFLTGSYNFFNLLTMALCLMLLDDSLLPGWLRRASRAGRDPAGLFPRVAGAVVLLAVLAISGSGLWQTFTGRLPPGMRPLLAAVEPFHLVNRYGVFAVMTTERRELVIEGSRDGQTWAEYPFRFKPGRLDRAPAWATPHQPRLDWQLWFAALGDYYNQYWVQPLLLDLLTGSKPVLGLFAANPFPDGPPAYVRVELYRYRFTTPEERARSGQWWQREYLGRYSPVLHVNRP